MEATMFGLLGENQVDPGLQSPTAVAVTALRAGWSLLEAAAIADDQARYV